MSITKEDMAFLELSETASPTEIMKRIDERQSIFKQLLENSPNAYLKDIQNKNIARLKEIRNHLTQNSDINPVKEVVAENDPQSSKLTSKGFLVKHTENTESKIFKLFSGKNYIGRISNDKPNEIIIEVNDSPIKITII